MVDNVARFKKLFAKAETLVAEALRDKDWDKYEKTLAVLDEMQALLPLDVQKLAVPIDVPDATYFCAAPYTKTTPTRTTLEIWGVEVAFIVEDFRYNCLLNLENEHPDEAARKRYAQRACKSARICIEEMNIGGHHWLQKFGARFIKHCNELGWYAVMHETTPKAWQRALRDLQPGYERAGEDPEFAFVKDTKARLLLKLGDEEGAFAIVRDVLARDPKNTWFDDIVKTPAYRAWIEKPESKKHALEDEIDGERYSADGTIAKKKFVGVWRTFDAKRKPRLEVDLTGEPCPDELVSEHLAAALIKRHVSKQKVPEVEEAFAIDWTKLDGACCESADRDVPLYLKALASHEPVVRRHAVTALAMSLDCDQGSVGEASAVAVPFLVALLAGKSADKVGRGYALSYLEGIASNIINAEARDDEYEACTAALRAELPRLKKLNDKAVGKLVKQIQKL